VEGGTGDLRWLLLALPGLAGAGCFEKLDPGVFDIAQREDAADAADDAVPDTRDDAPAPDGDADDAAGDGGSEDEAPDDTVEDDTVEDDAVEVDGASPCPPDMVLVPEGEFVMGSDSGEGETDEEPEHVVWLPAYCIEIDEVTSREYQDCMTDGGCSPPADGCVLPLPDDPAFCLKWDQLGAYCAWQGRELPTEAQWEKAARGGCELVLPEACGPEDERTYPWGEAVPDCTRAISSDCAPPSAPHPVGETSPLGDSPYGVHDMAGNVWEWAADWYSDTYYGSCTAGCSDPRGPGSGTRRVQRGGAYVHSSGLLRVAEREDRDPTLPAGTGVGGRCVLRP
jgi:formylglycine-generating enzyme required for sulfatase activity